MKEQPLLDLPAHEPSPHEATCMADLIEPLDRERIKRLCRMLKTTPQTEAAAMFGEDVDFYQLSQASAEKLRQALQKQLTLAALQAAHATHNAPEHNKAACALCSSYSND